MELNQKIGILSELRYHSNIQILKMYTISYLEPISFMPVSYGVKKKQSNTKAISNSPKQNTQKVTFKSL